MNPNRHKFFSLIFAAAFAALIYFLTSGDLVFRYLVPAFLLYLFGLAVYNWRYLLSQGQYNLWLLVRVPLFIFIWFGLLFIIPLGLVRAIFVFISVPIIFIFETLVANKGQQLGWNLFLVSLASLMLGLYGFHFYFPLSGLVYLALVFLGVTVLVRTSVDSVPHESSVKWFASLVLGLFSAQIFWILQFLPLHFSVLAILSFIILYLLWAIYYHYLYQSLTRRQIQFNLLLVIILSVIILISSPWTIQS